MSISQSASQNETAPAPVRLMSAREIGEMSLQKIGAYTPNHSGADTNELEFTLKWMEVCIGHVAGVNRLQWLVPSTVEFDLEDGIKKYDLEDVLGDQFPPLGIAYPIRAYVGTVTDPDDDDEEVSFKEIPIVRRADYEKHSNLSTAGTPQEIYVDRLNNDNKNVYVYPVQHENVNVRIRLEVQTYPRSVRGQSAQDTSGDTAHGFDVTWQKWLILETAGAIGDGPVRRLDATTIKNIKIEAAQAFVELLNAQNREKITHTRHRTKRWGP